ncbi:UTP--glucose-1-phosphate uridylyltransferase GalU [Candidatus Poribacteria bacterium]|nr:UTP--glucose-1-phosphate uridylyltransferase GalU [Candidatus Poribacteria bacterium]
MTMKVRKAVIPAAGLGTRFLPVTKSLPKEMIPVVDKPAIQYIIEEIVGSGIKDVLIITGRGKRAIEDHFDKSFELNEVLKEKGDHARLETLENIEEMADIHYLRQKEALGTGHAILKARDHIANEPFAVLYGDDLVISDIPCIKQLMDLYEKYSCTILAVQEVPQEKVSSYGIIEGRGVNGEVYLVDRLVEKPNPENAPSNLAFLGRCILDPAIFDILEKTKPAEDRREIQLTDAIQELAKRKAVYARKIRGNWHTVGDPISHLKTTIEFALQNEKIGSELKPYIVELGQRLLSKKAGKSEKDAEKKE